MWQNEFMEDINDTGLIPIGVPEQDKQAEHPDNDLPEILIITGMSGAGRTQAADTLEDLDWYVVDNLPPRLLGALAGMMTPDGGVRRLAAVVDVRSREFFSDLTSALESMRSTGCVSRVLFLDCSDEELVRRYDSVRRPHPLQSTGTILDGIQAERAMLSELRKKADFVIDTSGYSVHDLARKVRGLVADEAQTDVRVTVMSFGFKYGLPLDADNVVDVRFLPNPYWVTELRHLTGKDEPVSTFVLEKVGGGPFVQRYSELILSILDGYTKELKPFVTFAIGCTGGKHRSVAVAEAISEALRESGRNVRTIHRDLGRE